MRRDMDLVRELMLRLEGIKVMLPYGFHLRPGMGPLAIEGRDRDEITYHLDQIRQARFLNVGAGRPAMGFHFTGLTPAGHDFIDSVRNVDAWAATKERAAKVGNFSLGFLTDLAKAWAKAKAAEHGWM